MPGRLRLAAAVPVDETLDQGVLTGMEGHDDEPTARPQQSLGGRRDPVRVRRSSSLTAIRSAWNVRVAGSRGPWRPPLALCDDAGQSRRWWRSARRGVARRSRGRPSAACGSSPSSESSRVSSASSSRLTRSAAVAHRGPCACPAARRSERRSRAPLWSSWKDETPRSNTMPSTWATPRAAGGAMSRTVHGRWLGQDAGQPAAARAQRHPGRGRKPTTRASAAPAWRRCSRRHRRWRRRRRRRPAGARASSSLIEKNGPMGHSAFFHRRDINRPPNRIGTPRALRSTPTSSSNRSLWTHSRFVSSGRASTRKQNRKLVPTFIRRQVIRPPGQKLTNSTRLSSRTCKAALKATGRFINLAISDDTLAHYSARCRNTLAVSWR